MDVDVRKTCENIQAFTGEKGQLLRRAKVDGKTVLVLSSRKEMGPFQKFLSIFGWSDYNLKNVLKVIDTARKSSTQEQKDALNLLRSKLTKEPPKSGEKVDDVYQKTQTPERKSEPKSEPEPITKKPLPDNFEQMARDRAAELLQHIPEPKDAAKRYLQDMLRYEAENSGTLPNKKPISQRTVEAIAFLTDALQNMKNPAFTWDMARDDGDCFFDAAAQGISQAIGRKVTLKELKQEIKKFADEHTWVKELVMKDAKGGGYRSFEEYLETIGKPIAKGAKSIIWGRPTIEGKILSAIYGVRLNLLQALPDPAKPYLIARDVRDFSKENLERFIDMLSKGDAKYLVKANYVLKNLKVGEDRRIEILEGLSKKVESPPDESSDTSVDDAASLDELDQELLDEVTDEDTEEVQEPVKGFTQAMKDFDRPEYTAQADDLDSSELLKLVNDPRRGFTAPDWQQHLDGTARNKRDIYMAVYEGHFFPVLT